MANGAKKIDTLTDAANMQVITMSCVPLEFGQNVIH